MISVVLSGFILMNWNFSVKLKTYFSVPAIVVLGCFTAVAAQANYYAQPMVQAAPIMQPMMQPMVQPMMQPMVQPMMQPMIQAAPVIQAAPIIQAAPTVIQAAPTVIQAAPVVQQAPVQAQPTVPPLFRPNLGSLLRPY